MPEIILPELKSVEQNISPEQKTGAEQYPAPSSIEAPALVTKNIVPASVVIPSTTNPSVQDNSVRLEKVEAILSRDMDSIFLSLDSQKQQEFKIAGENAARQIESLVQKAKTTIKDIILVIINWLKIVPRINKFYLEQEAKIKADEIMKLYKK